MSKTSKPTHMSSLASQLQEKLKQDREKIAKLTSGELIQLASDLRSKTQSELAITNEDMATKHEALRTRVGMEIMTTQATVTKLADCLNVSWIAPPIIALSILLAGLFGTWGLTRYLSQQITHRIAVMEKLGIRQAEAQKTLDNLAEQAWGITLREYGQRRWTVLPPNLQADPSWTIDGQPAILLREQ